MVPEPGVSENLPAFVKALATLTAGEAANVLLDVVLVVVRLK
jgi:hypothetical protein